MYLSFPSLIMGAKTAQWAQSQRYALHEQGHHILSVSGFHSDSYPFGCGVNHSRLSSSGVTNVWNLPPLPLTSSWVGAIKQREKFTLTTSVMGTSEMESHLLPNYYELLCTVKQHSSLVNFILRVSVMVRGYGWLELGVLDFVWRLIYKLYMDPLWELETRQWCEVLRLYLAKLTLWEYSQI
jgi:hypothetical protein